MMYLLGMAALLAVLAGIHFLVPAKDTFNRPIAKGKLLLATLAMMVAFTIVNSTIVVNDGTIVITRWFGKQQDGYIAGGFSPINPMVDTTKVDIKPFLTNYTGKTRAEGLAGGTVQMYVEAMIPWRITPMYAPKLNVRVGIDQVDDVIERLGLSAIRDAVTQQPWAEGSASSGRDKLALAITKEIQSKTASYLRNSGFTAEEAEQAIVFLGAEVQDYQPKQTAILESIARQQAAVEDKKTEMTLTETAKIREERRQNDGLGITMMMGALPKDRTVAEMVMLIDAKARETLAEATMKCVETKCGSNFTVVNGGTASVAVPAGK
ncbi:MAG: hypothetical protein WAX89_00120 [Alphaproteobacteria bacterium]